jgi:hypothetical protein
VAKVTKDSRDNEGRGRRGHVKPDHPLFAQAFIS